MECNDVELPGSDAVLEENAGEKQQMVSSDGEMVKNDEVLEVNPEFDQASTEMVNIDIILAWNLYEYQYNLFSFSSQ